MATHCQTKLTISIMLTNDFKLRNMSKTKIPQAEKGSAFFELLVAIIISILFLMGTLQLVVYATMVRVQAKEQSDATSWIREDSDFLKYLASNLPCQGNNYDQYAQDLINELNSISDPELTEYTQATRTKYFDPTNPTTTRQYTFHRDMTANNNVLELTYYVDFNGDTTTCTPDPLDQSTWDGCIGVTYMEVTPDAAFECNG